MSACFTATVIDGIKPCAFTLWLQCSASRGAAVYADDRSILAFERTVFRNNTASEFGAALYLSTVSATFTDCTLADNALRSDPSAGAGALSSGGVALLAWSSSLTLDRVQCTGNAASFASPAQAAARTGDLRGGCLLASASSVVTIVNSTLSGNSAGNGGAIALNSGSQLVLRAATLRNNVAANAGGALHAEQAGQLLLLSVAFTANSAQQSHGGALFLVQSPCTANASVAFTGNAATQGGGGAVFWSELRPVLQPVTQMLSHSNAAAYGASCSPFPHLALVVSLLC